MLTRPSKDPWYASGVTVRHAICYDHDKFESTSWNHNHRSSQNDPKPVTDTSLDLRFLRTCKQIYEEAKLVPYTSNTFSFSRPRSVRAFLVGDQLRGPFINARKIRKAHFELAIRSGFDETAWASAMDVVASEVKSLQRVYVDIDYRPSTTFLTQRGYSNPTTNPFVRGLLQLRELPLRTVTIVLSDGEARFAGALGLSAYLEQQFRWSMAQKREWVEFMRYKLLSRG